MPARRRHLLGAPGGAGAAHVMQFWPVGIEGPGEELAPEGPDLRERIGMPIVAARRGGKGLRGDDGHDAPAVFLATCVALPALCRAETQFWFDSLKEGFNCTDLPHMVSAP